MHLVPVDPGLRLLAVNNAELESSSESATVPLAQLLVGLVVVAENAEYDACQTNPPLTARPPRMATTTAQRERSAEPNMVGTPSGTGRPPGSVQHVYFDEQCRKRTIRFP